MSSPKLLSHPRVHAYTRNYFVPDTPNLFLGGARPALSTRSFSRIVKWQRVAVTCENRAPHLNDPDTIFFIQPELQGFRAAIVIVP